MLIEALVKYDFVGTSVRLSKMKNGVRESGSSVRRRRGLCGESPGGTEAGARLEPGKQRVGRLRAKEATCLRGRRGVRGAGGRRSRKDWTRWEAGRDV